MATWWWERLLKGQVSLEVVIVIIILVLTFILVITQNNLRLEQNDFLKKVELQRTDCTRIQSVIGLVQTTKENSQLEIELTADVNISKNFVNFEYYFCEFSGAHAYTELTRGSVRVSKINEVLVFENF